METQQCHSHTLSVAAFIVQWQSWILKLYDPQSPKYLLFCFVQKNLVDCISESKKTETLASLWKTFLSWASFWSTMCLYAFCSGWEGLWRRVAIKGTNSTVRFPEFKSLLCDCGQDASLSVPHFLICKMELREVPPNRIPVRMKDHPFWLLAPGQTLLPLVLSF